MPMNIVIREKRKEIGLTQEQIAEYLGVSAPAVNKWEKGVTYPDISLLPALARLLGLDLNALLCFNEGLSEKETEHFCKEVIDTIRKSGFESGFNMGIEKIREYPNCGLLLHWTALVLEGALLMFGTGLENKEEYKNQIIALYERAAKSGDDKIRDKSVFMLASSYMGRMEYGKAQEMLDLLPERSAMDKKQLQAQLLIRQDKFSEAEKLLKRKLLTAVNEVNTTLMSLVDVELKENNNQEAVHLAELYRKFTELFDMWDYNSFAVELQIAIAQKNTGDSISILKSMFSALLTPWDISSSVLYSHNTAKNTVKSQVNIGTKVLPAILSELENDPRCAFLHSNAEFQQLIRQYRGKC